MSNNKKALAGAGTPTGAVETAACSGAAISCPHLITLESPRQVVAAALLAGAENAIEGTALAMTLGFKDRRAVSRFAQRLLETTGATIWPAIPMNCNGTLGRWIAASARYAAPAMPAGTRCGR